MPQRWRRLRALWLALGAAISWTAAPVASGQTAADIERAQQQSQQIIQQQQQQEQLRRQEEEERLHTPSGQDLNVPAPPAGPTAPGPCHKVTSIEINGAPHLDAAARNLATAPFLGQCLSLADINRLLAAITDAYVKMGLVTTRVYVPEQRLESGVLVLEVIEGRVESIRVTPAGSVAVGTAFPGIVGQVLNLRDLEQATDQINRLSSNAARIDIVPGSAPGESVLAVTDTVGKRWQGSLGVDNSGQASTGYDTTSASLSLDDGAGLNDYFNVSAHHSEAGDGQRHADGGALYWNVPYGYWNFSLAANTLHYGSVVSPPGFSFDTDGTSNAETLKAERLLYRDQSIKWGVATDLTLKQTWNAIAGERIDSSSADLSVLTAGTNLSWGNPGLLLSANAGVSEGFDGLGATADDAARPEGAPHAQFTRLNYGASLLKIVTLADLPLQWTTTVTGQAAGRALYGTEEIALGSLYTVRGYRLDTLSGRTGFYVRDDLALPLTLKRAVGIDADGEIKPYLGVDFGRVLEQGEISGWSLGVATRYRWTTLEFSYSHPMASPGFLPREHGWWFAHLVFTY